MHDYEAKFVYQAQKKQFQCGWNKQLYYYQFFKQELLLPITLQYIERNIALQFYMERKIFYFLKLTRKNQTYTCAKG